MSKRAELQCSQCD